MNEQVDISQLDDRRSEIAENVFLEVDIARKAYQLCFGEDTAFNDLELIHANIAMILNIHNTHHNLYDVDMDGFSIPSSKFVNDAGASIDKIYLLKPIDQISYICNILGNSQLGFNELIKSGYMDEMMSDNTLIVSIETVINIINNKIDEVILRTNILLNKL